MKFILGKKIGMSQTFDEQGRVVPVTLVEAGPCWVTQVRTKEKDGYQAAQIGFGPVKEKRVNKAQLGQFRKNKLEQNFRYLREFKNGSYQLGDRIDVSLFIPGEQVSVSGISKGKGFQGVVKRHGFAGGPASHGGRHNLRAPGSIGSAFPERVVKGKKMAGQMGNQRIRLMNLKVVEVDPENNLLALKGALPGRPGSLLEIKATKEIKEVEKEEWEKLEELTKKKQEKEGEPKE